MTNIGNFNKNLNKNAAFNVAGGLATMMLSIALPPVLSRTLEPINLSIWMFSLQVANYLMILNLGLQLVVARLVAQAETSGDIHRRNTIISTAFFILLGVSITGFIFLSYSVEILLLSGATALQESRETVIATISWIAASFIAWLPASLLLSTFIGQQRNIWYALAMSFTRIIILISVASIAYIYSDVVAMAKGWFVATVIGSIGIIILYFGKVDAPVISVRFFRNSNVVILLKNSLAISLWNILVLLVTGGQVLILGIYDIASIAIFASALALSTVMIGVSGAISATIVPIVAAYISKGTNNIPTDDFFRISLIGNIVNFGGSSVLAIGGWWVSRLWLGDFYSDAGSIVLGSVAISQALRNCFSTYAMVTIGVGLQNKLIIGPLGEGIFAIILSYYLTQTMGIYGVITAMLVSPAFNIVCTIIVNPLRAYDPAFRLSRFIQKAVVPPAIPLIATLGVIATVGTKELHSPLAGIVALVVMAGYAYWAIRVFFRFGAQQMAERGY